MKKMYHITDWTTPKLFYDKYISRIYALYGSTKIEPTLDFGAADFVVMTNQLLPIAGATEQDLARKRLIIHQYEPPSRHSMWGKWSDPVRMDKEAFKFFDMQRNRPIVWPYFDVKGQNFEPCAEFTSAARRDRMCFITSLWNMYPGHKLRLHILDYFKRVGLDYDLYGGKQYTATSTTIDQYPQWKDIEVANKHDVLNTYKYALVVENTYEPNWFSEKLWDCLISENLAFYWGCPSIDNFIPSEAVIKLPENGSLEEIRHIIINAMARDEYSKRLPAIREAKKVMLEKYDLIHTLEDIVK